MFKKEESGRNPLILSRSNSSEEQDLLGNLTGCQEKLQSWWKKLFLPLILHPIHNGILHTKSSSLSMQSATLQILTIKGYKRESLHAYIHKWVRLKCSSPPDTRALSPGCCVHFSNVSISSVWMSLSRLSSLHWTYA